MFIKIVIKIVLLIIISIYLAKSVKWKYNYEATKGTTQRQPYLLLGVALCLINFIFNLKITNII